MQKIREYLSTKELHQRYQNCKDPVEAKRWYLLWQVSLSETVKEVALKMNLNYNYALSIVRKYNRYGPIIVQDNRKLSWKSRKALRQANQKNNQSFLDE